MATLLDTHEIQTGDAPLFSVIWLHGLGADGFDFAPIVPELLQAHWPALRFVFPHAPKRAVTVNNGMPMRAWYDIKSMNFNDRADETGVRESMAQLEVLIHREIERGVARERIFLAGFSQGGAIVLSYAMRSENPFAGVMALSTYLPMPEATANERPAHPAKIPLFYAHGSADPVIPIAIAQASVATLEHWGQAVQWHSYPMAHAVCENEIRDLAHWIGTRMAELSAQKPAG